AWPGGWVDPVKALAFSPDGALVAEANDRGRVILWEVKSGKLLRVLEGHEDTVTGVTFSPDGRWLLSAGVDRTVRVWEVSTGREASRFAEHPSPVHYLTFLGDGKRVFSCCRERLLIRDFATGETRRSLAVPDGFTRDVTRDGRFVVRWRDGDYEVW